LTIVLNKLLGKTTSKGAEDEDLSIDVLVADFIDLVRTVFKDPETAPTFLVITPTS
jgi:protein phosphatase methylesterase 1